MSKLKLKDIVFLITYTILLVACLIKLDIVLSVISQFFVLLAPIFLGGVIAFILKKPYDLIYHQLKKRLRDKSCNLSKAIAVLAVYLALIGFIAVIMSIVVPQFIKSWKMLIISLETVMPAVNNWLQAAMKELSLSNMAEMQQSAKKLTDVIGGFVMGAMPQLFSITNSVVKTVTNLVLGVVFSIYMLLSREELAKQTSRMLKAFLNEKWYSRVIRISRISNETFTKFVSGQLTEAFILGGMCFIGMAVLKLEYALLISVLVGVTSLIPIVGAFIGAVPSAFILFMISPQKALIFIVFLLALQQFEGNIIYPKVVGSSIGLPALWIMAAITIGGGMGGIVGMLLAVPVTSIIYKVVGEIIENRLSDKPDAD